MLAWGEPPLHSVAKMFKQYIYFATFYIMHNASSIGPQHQYLLWLKDWVFFTAFHPSTTTIFWYFCAFRERWSCSLLAISNQGMSKGIFLTFPYTLLDPENGTTQSRTPFLLIFPYNTLWWSIEENDSKQHECYLISGLLWSGFSAFFLGFGHFYHKNTTSI